MNTRNGGEGSCFGGTGGTGGKSGGGGGGVGFSGSRGGGGGNGMPTWARADRGPPISGRVMAISAIPVVKATVVGRTQPAPVSNLFYRRHVRSNRLIGACSRAGAVEKGPLTAATTIGSIWCCSVTEA